MINKQMYNKLNTKQNRRLLRQLYKSADTPAKMLALVLLVAAALVIMLLPNSRQLTGDFEAAFLDVGQGDSILICADDHTVLIDAGGLPGDSTVMAEQVVIPYIKSLGIEKLDLVVNTHPDNDHIGGLFAVLDDLQVDNLAMFDGYEDSRKQQQLLSLAKAENINVRSVAAGDVLEFSENFKIEVLSPEYGDIFDDDHVNNGSLVLHISYQDFDMLTTGDLQGWEQDSAIRGLDCTDIEVLQLPHHGSKNSYDEDWYAEFNPEAVIISCGIDNDYGHPGKNVVKYWQQEQVDIYRTDHHGSCRVIYKDGVLSFETAETAETAENAA